MSWTDVAAVAVIIASLSSALFAALSWYQADEARKKVEEHDRWERWMFEEGQRKK
jgi:hypothetical protein